MTFDTDRFIAGFIGCFGIQILHPLDLIRLRMQAIDNTKTSNLPYKKKYKNLIKGMLKKEGIINFYRGVVYTFPLNSVVGIYFGIHAKLKNQLKTKFFKSNENLSIFSSTLILGSLFALIINPFYTIKTWIYCDTNTEKNKKINFKKAISKIYSQNGIKGFYRGAIPTLAMAFSGTFTVGINEFLRSHFKTDISDFSSNFFFGGISRIISSSIFYPIATIRTRVMQNQKFQGLEGLKYENLRLCAKLTFQNEGIRGFYGGLGVNAPRSFLSSAVLFSVYHKVHAFLRDRR